MTNLLAQTKEIKRLEKEDERRREEEAQNERERADEVQEEVVRGFEKTMTGADPEVSHNPSKRKLADSLSNDTFDGRATARRRLDGEKASKAKSYILQLIVIGF